MKKNIKKSARVDMAEMRSKPRPLMKTNTDGWSNLLAGVGKSGVDKTKHTRPDVHLILPDDYLTQIWVGDGIGKKIVSSVADDMTRNGFNVTGDVSGNIDKELTRLNALKMINEALLWTRLYRGAIIVVGARDGAKLDMPLNEKNIKGIDWLRVFPAPQISVNYSDIDYNLSSKTYGDATRYTIQKIYGGTFDVHSSRCITFRGVPTPQIANVDSIVRYWGLSVLQAGYDQLKNFGAVSQSFASIMLDFVVGVYKLSNLAEILSENNTQAVLSRIEVINASKSILNAVLIGEDEEFRRDVANLAGAADGFDKMMQLLAGVFDYPVTRLFGRSAAGMNATGENDMQAYYDMVASQQTTYLLPHVQKLVDMVAAYIPTEGGVYPAVTFNPVWSPSQKELVDMKYKQAQTDEIYMNSGVLTSEDVAENRFMNGFSFETTISDIDNVGADPLEE